MNCQSYVREVGKRLQCSEKKRKEIERQLASDIQAALENGETMEEILERMGTAKEAAREFNSNFTEDDRKEGGQGRVRLSLGLIGMAAAAAVIIAIFVIVGVRWKHAAQEKKEKQTETTTQADRQKEKDSGQEEELPQVTELTQGDDTFSTEAVEEKTKQIIQAFQEENFQLLYDDGTENLKHALGGTYSDATWKAAKNQISSDWGQFVSYGNIYMGKVIQDGESYAVVQINVSYEKVSVTYTITFDADMGLDGFYVK